MARLYLKKTLSGFVPADEPTAALMGRYKAGEIYRGDVVKPRNYQSHKLCMALLTLTWKNLPERFEGLWKSFDDFRKGIAMEAGHIEVVKTPDGVIHESPGSLSYDALDEIEFTTVFGAMMTVCTKILDMGEPELAAEVSRYADENYGRVA